MTRTGVILCSLAIGGLAAGAALFRSAPDPTRDETQTAADDFTFTLNHPPMVVPTVTVLRFEVPIVNRTTDEVRFAEPIHCQCSCSESRLVKQSLIPGEATVAEVSVRTLAVKSGRQHFACRWADDRGRQWTANVAVDLYDPQDFDTDRISFGAVRLGERRTKTAAYRQYAQRESELAPPPEFELRGRSVAMTAGVATVRTVADGLVVRETPLTFATGNSAVLETVDGSCAMAADCVNRSTCYPQDVVYGTPATNYKSWKHWTIINYGNCTGPAIGGSKCDKFTSVPCAKVRMYTTTDCTVDNFAEVTLYANACCNLN